MMMVTMLTIEDNNDEWDTNVIKRRRDEDHDHDDDDGESMTLMMTLWC